jgi:autonomous glycyl radical cofactor GrcA
METGADDDVMAIYEVNSAAQIREVRVEIKPTIRVGRWNVPNLMDPGRETFT